MADGNLCNFNLARPETRPGILTNCGTMCGGIQGGVAGFGETLEAFAAYVQDNFGSSKSAIKYKCFKQTRSVWNYHLNCIVQSNKYIFLDNHGAPPESRDECGERINTLFKNIQKFEEITGSIQTIPDTLPFFAEPNRSK